MDRFRFGRSIRALRQRRGWRQVDRGDRLGVSRSLIGRIERGDIGSVPFDRLVAVASALDGRLDQDFRWRGEQLDRLVDERHAAIVDELVGIYRAARWDAAVEVTFSIYGERGSIDVFAWHPIRHVVAVNEVKGSVGEAGNTVLGVDRKSRLAPRIARERGWPCRAVARFLVVADGTTARDRIARHADTFRTALPAGTRESLAWIKDPDGEPPSGIIFIAPRNARRVTAAKRDRAEEGPITARARSATPDQRR